MNICLIRHHVPSLKQTKTKFAYISSYCCFCKADTNRIFRVNLKLKVFKCYNCGRSGKDMNKFFSLLKKQKINRYRVGQLEKAVFGFDVYYGCDSEEQSKLPF